MTNPTTSSSSSSLSAAEATPLSSSSRMNPTTNTSTTTTSFEPPPVGVLTNTNNLFLDTIPEDSDLELPASNVSVAADTATDEGDEQQRQEHQQQKSWWKLRTAALLQPQQPPSQQQQQVVPTRRLSSAPSVPDDESSERASAPPSSTGAMEAGHSGSVADLSEVGAVIIADGQSEPPHAGRTLPSRHHRHRRRHRPTTTTSIKRPIEPLSPEEKRRRQQRFYLLLVLGICVMAGIVVGIVFAVQSTAGNSNNNNHHNNNNNTSTLAPTTSPTIETSRYSNATIQLLDDVLFNISSSSSSWINDPSSPRYLARHWLLQVDQLHVVGNLALHGIEDPNAVRRVIQRYILCLLYWNFDGPEGLLNATLHECDWIGVGCYDNVTTTTNTTAPPPDDAVRIMAWENNNLNGTLPDELGHLTWLRNIQMDENNITGTLPWDAWTRFGPWTELKHMSLSHNQIQGRLVPTTTTTDTTTTTTTTNTTTTWWDAFPNLYYLDLSFNQLTGPLMDWTKLSNLGYLYMSNNNLTGSIVTTNTTSSSSSSQDAAASPLQVLDLSINDLNGSIMNALNWSWYSSLEYLVLQNNSFSGRLVVVVESNHTTTTISSPLSVLTSLSLLDVSINQFTGPLLDISPFSVLETLYLNDNAFTGTLMEPPTTTTSSGSVAASNATSVAAPSSITSALTDVRASDNYLTGTLSSTWAILPTLTTLILYGNLLKGTLPTTWSSEELFYLDLSYNQFSGSIPESLLELSALHDLFLNNNRFTKLPPGNQSSGTLQLVSLSSNLLQGTIPPDFALYWTNLTGLSLTNNSLLSGTLDVCNITYLQADCKSTNTTITSATTSFTGVTCSCCTLCN